jgi:hypothetical protein
MRNRGAKKGASRGIKRGLKRGFGLGVLGIFAVFTILFFGILASLASAFETRDVEIDKTYGSDENLRGFFNISTSEDLASLMFKAVFTMIFSSQDMGLSLKEVLEANNVNYSCMPASCKDGYLLSNGLAEKRILTNVGEDKIVAFKIQGPGVSFKSLAFSMFINNSLTCESPVKIDLLNNYIIDWKVENATKDYSCNYRTGCFISGDSSDSVFINEKPYCEKISLPVSKKFRIGAWIKKGSTQFSNDLIEMSLYSLESEWIASCNLPEPNVSGGGVGCEIEYENEKEKEVYVCINAREDTDYAIKTEGEEPCGFYSYIEEFNGNFVADYYIFVSTPKYDKIGEIKFSGLDYETGEYIQQEYNNNCSEGCVIPVRLIPSFNGNVMIYNSSLNYVSETGVRVENKIYDTDSMPLRISSGKALINLETLGIKVPSSPGKYDLSLFLNESLIEEREIQVERFRVVQGVYPRHVVLKNPTLFQIVLGKNVSISEIEWNFGDGTILKTTSQKVMYAYNFSGTYKLKVTLSATDGKSYSGEFNVSVSSAKEAVNYTLSSYQKSINSVDSKILGLLPSWCQRQVKERIIGNLTSQTISLMQMFGKAVSDSEYVAILDSLYSLKVPISIGISLQGGAPYYVDYQDIDIEKLKKLGAGEEDAEKERISRWISENVDLRMEFKVMDAEYRGGKESIGTVFKIKILPKQEQDLKNFVVVEGQSSFKPDSREQKVDGAFSIAYDDLRQREIEFLQYNVTDPSKLKVYISPVFSGLEGVRFERKCNYNNKCEKALGENTSNCRDCKMRLIYLAIFGIAAFTLLCIVLMIIWYRKKYESYLFKEKKDIYNITSFIRTARKQGMQKGEIYKKLKKEGWNSEQVSYALMKVEGGILARILGVKKSKTEVA